MTLKIDREVCQAMLDAAQSAFPLEACGLCGGLPGRITRFFGMTNVDASGEHFSMLPAEQFKAVKSMRSENIALQAIWHSHPETPARMSDEDLRLAYTPDIIYLITSLAQPGNPDLRGFTVVDGRSLPIKLEVVNQ